MNDAFCWGQQMADTPKLSKYFSSLPDPRVERTRRHSLNEMLIIAICAIICGADDWVSIEEFGEAKLTWFKTFLDLPNGIPSHDTFGRVFSSLDPDTFARCFAEWVAAIAEVSQGQVVAIDGKTLRRSFDRASGKTAIHMVSAWSGMNNLVLGQVKTEEKSNEITAIPKLLQILDLHGCIVTIDAMGCQKEIAGTIINKGADYVLGLKGNHEKLFHNVEAYFHEAVQRQFSDVTHDTYQESDKAHGREEVREFWCTSDLDWFDGSSEWPGLRSIAMVESKRTIQNKTSIERRYFISSLAGDNAKEFAKAIRGHWGIENNLHWILDVAFREDDCRVRKDHAPQNFSMLRHIAINLLKQEKSAKIGIKNKRLKSGWDERYLLKILGI